MLKWFSILLIWLLFIGGLLFLWFGYDLPDIMKLQQTCRRPSITILARDGTKLATYGDLHGQMVDVATLPAPVIQSLLAIEDRRFYSHLGLDPIGLIRAFWVNYQSGHVVQGGSTLTQQLAKNFLQSEKLYDFKDRSLRRKIQEAMLALWLEYKFTKNQILTLYLNRVYLGAGTFGLAAASQHYFGKRPQELNLYEAAVLAGLLKAPSHYSPSTNPERADQRAAQVLDSMVQAGTIREGEKKAALALASATPSPLRGSSTRYFTDWIVDLLETWHDLADRDVIVTTTLDPRLQTLGASCLHHILEEQGEAANASQMALVSLSLEGAVRALVGGADYRKSQYNRVTQAKRQAGSTFKLILYLSALEAGMLPWDRMNDTPIRIGSWCPKNHSHYQTQGVISLQDAFAQSSNTVSVRLVQKLGLSPIFKMARRLGMQSPLPKDLTIVLGTGDTTLLEITSAYAVVARQGISVEPYGITRITDLEGHVLYTYQAPVPHRVLELPIARTMTHMLQAVMSYGTGRRGAIPGFCAGKTGTTQVDRDAWFVGFTSRLVTGIWAGNDNNTSMNPEAGSPSVQLWRRFMKKAGTSASPVQASDISGLLEGMEE